MIKLKRAYDPVLQDRWQALPGRTTVAVRSHEIKCKPEQDVD
jgi:hypothetical protein